MKNHIFLAVFSTIIFPHTLQAQSIEPDAKIQEFKEGKDAPRAALPKALQEERKQAKADLNSKGYMVQTDKLPRSELVLERLQQETNKTAAQQQGLLDQETNAPNGIARNPPAFQKLEDFNVSQSPIELRTVPDYAIRDDSENIVIAGNATVMRIYSKTDYGTLLVEETKGELFLDEPNLSVAGYDAKVAVSKHKDGKWATTIFATDGTKIYRIESNKRLKDDTLDAFVLFISDIISG